MSDASDFVRLLQGGALAAAAAILAPAIYREIQRRAIRQTWRQVWRSPAIREWAKLILVIAPYAGLAALAWIYTATPLYLLLIPLPLLLASVARRRKRRLLTFSLLLAGSAALCTLLWSPVAGLVVLASGMIRYLASLL